MDESFMFVFLTRPSGSHSRIYCWDMHEYRDETVHGDMKEHRDTGLEDSNGFNELVLGDDIVKES